MVSRLPGWGRPFWHTAFSRLPLVNRQRRMASKLTKAEKRKRKAYLEKARLGPRADQVPGRVRFVPYGLNSDVSLDEQDYLAFRQYEGAPTLSSPDIEAAVARTTTQQDAYPTLGYLWVYDPEDLAELTLDEVHTVWENRDHLCGSREAAAEALAIIELDEGVVDNYQGWRAYLGRDEIRSLTPSLAPDEREEETEDTQIAAAETSPSEPDAVDMAPTPLARRELIGLSDEALQEAWNRRPDSFASVEAACSALARLRAKAGLPSPGGWHQLLEHEEILKLVDELPERDAEGGEVAASSHTAISPGPSAASLKSDARTRRQQDIVVREGQPGFRQEVLDNYYGRCCATGCRETVILEAAHISPYSGAHSNYPANGLCLRVDVHRLFDAFLLSIEPETRQWVVAPRLAEDPTYQVLDGKRIFPGRVAASRDLLGEHYQRFRERHPELARSTLTSPTVET